MCKSINLGLFLALVVFLTRPSRFWANPKIGDLLTSDDVINDDIIICYISFYRSHQDLYNGGRFIKIGPWKLMLCQI